MTTITAPTAGTNGRAVAITTTPTTADIVAGGATALQPPEVVSGVATQYWDEAVALPAGSPNRLWLLVDGAWRQLTSPGTATRDVVQRAFLGTDSAVHVWYDGSGIVGLVVTGT